MLKKRNCNQRICGYNLTGAKKNILAADSQIIAASACHIELIGYNLLAQAEHKPGL
jgi:hypothetical protein